MESECNYKMESYAASQKQQKLRDDTWKTKKCKGLYKKLINYVGGFNVVRCGMRGKAKQLVITCCIKGIEPNFETFNESVQKANSINNYSKSKSRQIKHNEKTDSSFENQEKEIESIMFKILDEFDVKIPLICRPLSVKEAWDLYYEIKNDKESEMEELF